MPSCVVKFCKNNSKVQKKSGGITFHLFPTKSETKKEWVSAVRISRNDPQWQPSSTSVVCSDHFHDSDLYFTSRGLRRVDKTGYPKKNLFPSDVIIYYTALPSTSTASFPDLPGPSSAAANNNVLLSSSNEDVDNTSLPSTPTASFLHLPGPPSAAVDNKILLTSSNEDIDNTALPSSSTASFLDLPCPPSLAVDNKETAVTSRVVVDQESIFDTPIKYKLRKKIKKLEHQEEENKEKIQTLKQRVRRLTDQNKSLGDILINLKKKNYIDTELYNLLNENMTIRDILNNINKKHTKNTSTVKNEKQVSQKNLSSI